MAGWHPRNNYKDRPKRQIKRKVKTPPTSPVECNLVGTDGSSVHFFSVKSAKRALAGLIALLPKRVSEDEPKKYVIEK